MLWLFLLKQTLLAIFAWVIWISSGFVAFAKMLRAMDWALAQALPLVMVTPSPTGSVVSLICCDVILVNNFSISYFVVLFVFAAL